MENAVTLVRLTVSQAMDRLKLREIKPGHVREAASYRARRRNAARFVRRRMGGRPKLTDLPYVPPPKVPPQTVRRAEAVADRLVTAAFGREQLRRLTDLKTARG